MAYIHPRRRATNSSVPVTSIVPPTIIANAHSASATGRPPTFIPQAPKIFVSGEVKSPGAYPFSPGLTVRQLVILAGGLTEDGSATRIRAIRKGEDGKTREVKIQMDDLVTLGDTLLVKAKLF